MIDVIKLLYSAKFATFDGKNLTIHFSNSTNTRHARCINNIGKYKVFVDKVWGGNGFGYNSDTYVVNTITKEVWKDFDIGHKKLVSMLKKQVEEGE